MQKTRHTIKKHTRRKQKRKRTRHRRRTRGGEVQVIGGYKEGMVILGGKKGKVKFAISDYPPGFSKFTRRDKRQWTKMKRKSRKHKRRRKSRDCYL